MDFNKKLSSSIEQVKSNSSNTITNLFYLIRSFNLGNALVSMYGTNFEYIFPLEMEQDPYLCTQALVYDNNCSCDSYSNCTSQANFILSNSFDRIPINGLKIGCLPSESLRSSTLECFYNQSCIHLIQQYINYNGPSISSLANLSRFPINTTVNELIDNMFIEEWRTQINYSSYFHQCSPLLCSYTYIQSVDLTYTITFLLGLQGGLTIVLKWITPKLSQIIYKIYKQYRKKRTNIVHIQPSIEVFNNTDTSTTTGYIHASKIISICSIAMFLITGIIVFSIYIIPKENRTTSTTFPTTDVNFNSTILSTITITTTTTTTFRKTCESTFDSIPLYYIYPQYPILADFTNDGKLDIAFTTQMSASITVLPGLGDGTFTTEIVSSMSSIDCFCTMLTTIVSGDINNDNKIDILFSAESYILGVLLGNGDGSFEVQPVFLTFITNPIELPILADFDNDTYLDIVVIEGITSIISLFVGHGNGSFTLKVTLDGGEIDFPIFIDTNDANNDGYLDILIVNLSGKSVSVFFGYGNGNFQTRITSFTGGALTPMRMSFGDFNNDSLLDIIVAYRVYKFSIMFGFGNGTFANRKTLAANQTISAIVTSVGDFNNDGHQDIVVSECLPMTVNIFYGNGHGQFWSQTIFSNDIFGVLTWINVGDFNNDGHQDILATEKASGVMTLLLNRNQCNSTLI